MGFLQMIPYTNNMQEYGQKYLDLGFSIIPLGQIKKKAGGGKDIEYPIAWTPYKTRKPTSTELLSWSKHYTNIGIITGRISNLLVLDADEYKPAFDHALFKSFHIPPTPCQRTANGGHQYFFKAHPSLEIHNAVCIGSETSGLDIRGDGGMVIVPPTQTTYGEYEWIVSPEDQELADIPQPLLDLLLKNPLNNPTIVTQHKPLNSLVNLPEGAGRDNAMTVFIGGLLHSRHPDTWESEVWPMIEAVNATYLPPLSEKDLQRIYKSITTKELASKQSKTAPKPFEPSFTLSTLLTTEYPPARFILDPYFEMDAVNMISAPPNSWKSWFIFLLATAVAEGSELFNHFKTSQAKVMIVNEEDSPRSIQDRFRVLGITNKDLPIHFHVAQGLKIDPTFVTNIVKEMQATGCTVLFLDSLRSMHEAEENDSTEMQEILDHLKAIARNNITIVFTHHHRKKNPFEKESTSESARGSSAISAAISGHISLDEEVRDGGTFLIVRHLKSKVTSKIEPVEIKISKMPLTNTMDFEYQGKFKSSEKKIEQSKEKIIELVKDGEWRTVNDFIEIVAASKNIIRAALNELCKAGLVKALTRGEAVKQGIEVSGTGRANENVYAECSGKDNELDSFAEEATSS
jgi:hypothetical protein